MIRELIDELRGHPDSAPESPVDQERIRELEAELKEVLPGDFVEFHLALGGGEYPFARMLSLENAPCPPQPYAANLVHGRAPEPGAFVVLIEQGSCELTQSLHLLYDVAGCARPGLLPFAEDWGGNLYCFDTASRSPRGVVPVVFVDHEGAIPEPQPFAKDFASFIEEAWPDDDGGEDGE